MKIRPLFFVVLLAFTVQIFAEMPTGTVVFKMMALRLVPAMVALRLGNQDKTPTGIIHFLNILNLVVCSILIPELNQIAILK